MYRQLRCSNHTAQVHHTCDACGQMIDPGQRYTSLIAVIGGRFNATKTHFESCPTWEESWDEEHEADRFCWKGRDAA